MDKPSRSNRHTQLLQYLFVGLALLTSATAVYAVAYQLIMPTKLHEKVRRVHFCMYERMETHTFSCMLYA